MLVAFFSTSLAAAQENALFGKTVATVAYTSDGPVDADEVSRLIAIRAGEPLTEDSTGATIRNLFATRQFSDVRVSGVESAAGVEVTVELFLAFRVAPLKFSTAPVPRAELRRVLPFAEGAVYQAEALAQGAAAIKRRLAEDGYLTPVVTPEVSLDRKTFKAAVLYRIVPGKPARTAPPFFDGDTAPYGASALLAKAHLKPGDRYRESKARADAARMTEFLHKQSRLKGAVELIAAQPTEDGRVMPVYRVSVGPDVLFDTRGIKTKTVRNDLHALSEGQVFDEDIVLLYVEQKRKDLQARGRYRAKVDYSWKQKAEALTIAITVEEGPKLAVEKIAFSGNRSVKAKNLLAIMATRKKGLPLLRPGHLVDDDLSGDVSAILGYYQTRGWVGARVEKPKVTEGSRPNRLVVTIPIEEGPRAVVAEVKVEGAEHAADAAAEKTLKIKRGAFFNPYLVREDVVNLATFYHDHGWREASVKDEVRISDDGGRAQVAYRVEEGTRTFFGKTIVRGNARTRTERVARQVVWKEGRAFSEAELLQTQRNLTRTGVFRRVDIRPQAADPKTQIRNVEIDLQEGRPLALLYGVGYQYAPDAAENQSDPFLIGGISYNNLFGRMQSAGFEAQIAPISRRGRLQASFREPFLFNTQFPLTVLTYYIVEPISDIDIRRLGTVVESSRYYGKFLRIAMRYAYERITPVNSQDLSSIELQNFPRADQPIQQSTIGPNVFYDRRDDIIDPRTGYYVTVSTKYAFPLLLANARYTKLSGQGAYFRSFAGGVFAVAARGGAIFPYNVEKGVPVPLAERFFAGGRTTNRAFETDLLGIPGETVDPDTRATVHTGEGVGSCAATYPDLTGYDCDAGPRIVGGNGFLGFNAEYRFPIFGNLGGTIFYDAAQVWKRPADIRLAIEGDRGLRQGVGVGLRYMTPIGPVRVEYGWPIDPRVVPFNVTLVDDKGNVVGVLASATRQEKGRFFFSIGYPF